MNNFIFWDSAAKEFYDNINTFYEDNVNYKCALVDGKVLVHHYESEYEEGLFNPYKEDNIIIALKDIELKDINGKSIYSSSSIVEITLANRYKIKGYFYFDIKNLRYFFAFIDLHIMAVEKFSEYYKKAHSHNYINEKIFWSMEYSHELFSDIEIIDTIQENKLGLIK